MIADHKELYRFLAKPTIEVMNVLFAGGEVVRATWKYAEEDQMMPVLHHTKELIEAYVTTGACRKLYIYLDALKERALFCDTDSVLYVKRQL